MPTTFTHHKFGKDVYKELPEEVKNIIRSRKKEYILGLQGPDIFFYHLPFVKNKVFQRGIELHDNDAYSFFQRSIEEYKKKPTKALLAYLLGFACHFILDSTCHPFIYKVQERAHLSHSEIESCLDREEMLACGIDPYTYKPASAVGIKAADCQELLNLFPGLTKRQWKRALRGFRFYTGIGVLRYEFQRAAVVGFLGKFERAKEIKGRFIVKVYKRRCLRCVDILRTVFYKRARMEASSLLVNLYECAVSQGDLSGRFKRNYNG